MLATPGKGFALAVQTFEGGLMVVAPQAFGLDKGAYEIARKYLMKCQQFGKTLFKQ